MWSCLNRRLVRWRVGRRGLSAAIESRRKLEAEAAEATYLAALTRVYSLLKPMSGTALSALVASATSTFLFTLVWTEIVHRLGTSL